MSAAPGATVAIVTRNRRDDLRVALESAVAQEGSPEILVIDDGSTDDTAAMVRREFPSVVLERFESRAGLVVRRNDAARLATGSIVVSIDDDAAFSSSHVVAQAVEDFDHPRIGAVAIPHVDIRRGSEELHRPPDSVGRWVTATFRGTAYAVRRDVFLALGGFREAIVHQGEEPDFALRMLASGYVVRLSRADTIHHFESVTRDLDRMTIYGRRNEVLLASTHFPWPDALLLMGRYAAKGMVLGVRLGLVRPTLRGLWLGMKTAWELRDERHPVPRKTLRLDRRLRRAGALPLDDVEPLLPPLASADLVPATNET